MTINQGEKLARSRNDDTQQLVQLPATRRGHLQEWYLGFDYTWIIILETHASHVWKIEFLFNWGVCVLLGLLLKHVECELTQAI